MLFQQNLTFSKKILNEIENLIEGYKLSQII